MQALEKEIYLMTRDSIDSWRATEYPTEAIVPSVQNIRIMMVALNEVKIKYHNSL